MDFEHTPAALAILGLTIVISLLGLFAAPQIKDRNVLRPYWLLREKQYSSLITCGFIHADLGHLLFNSLTMFFFGPTLELRIGTARFVALYFIGLALSSLGTVWKHRKNPDYASLGASGAILAVLFAFIVYFPNRSIGFLFIPVPIPAPLFALLYLGYTWWSSNNSRGRVNHDAHLDGAITGMLFVAITDIRAWDRALHLVFS